MQAWIATTQDELQEALRAGARHVYLDGMLTVRPPDEGGYPRWHTSVLDVWNRGQNLRLAGMKPGSGAQYRDAFDGAYPVSPVLVLRFRRQSLTLAGLIGRNYNWKGTFIKPEGCGATVVDGCTFHHIGDVPFPYGHYGDAIEGGTNDPHVFVTFGCLAGSSEHLTVRDTVFEDCTRNASAWAHCLYMSGGGYANVHGCRFARCGNPLALDYAQVSVEHNDIDLAPCRRRDGAMIGPAILYADAQNVLFRYNTVTGNVGRFGAAKRLPKGQIDYNDYSRATFTGDRWFTVWGQGGPRTFAEWQALGYDRHSNPPKEAPDA